MVLPADQFFSFPELRREASKTDLLVHGPAHLFRAAWLAGIRDYLREPWTADELFLRLRGAKPEILAWQWGEIQLTLEGLTLRATPGSLIKLSRAESDLVRLLALRQGTTVTRGVLAWVAICSEGRVVDTLVARLRRKIQAVARRSDNPISSVRGLGYRLP